MRLTRFAPLLGILLLIVVLAGCGSSGSSSSSESSTSAGGGGGSKAVSIKNFAYAPADLTVAKGTTVSFANGDSTNHTATATDASVFDTGTIAPGKTKTVTLDKSGTFAFFCSFHPFMKGTITVE
jgi:plastocyanin